MHVPLTRAARWIAAGLAVLSVMPFAQPSRARAETTAFDVADQPVVHVLVRGRGNDVTVRVWDRSSVQVDANDEGTQVQHGVALLGTPSAPLVQPIPPTLFAQADALPPVDAIPPEVFPYATIRAGEHDVVRVQAPEGSHLVVTVPAQTAILTLRVAAGRTAIEGYHGANLLLVQGGGHVRISGAVTTAFVQLNNGALTAENSTFERVRVRGIGALDVFEHCRATQIEASSVNGSIVYDGGSFMPGLARFETRSGNIALGVTSGAHFEGRSESGRVYTLLNRGSSVDERAEGETEATVGDGRALVSALTARGNVYFYEGSMEGRRKLPPEWRVVQGSVARTSRRERVRAGTSAAARRRA